MGNSKEPIRLRKRTTRTGNVSLYLDIYLNGARSYEYLKLYLVPERSRADKEKNRETMKLAEAIKAKRIVELRNGEFGFKSGYASETKFFDYYCSLCEKRLGAESKSNWGNWYSCLHHLRIYEKRSDITFAEITPEWVQGFKDYLDNRAIAWAHDVRHREKEFLEKPCDFDPFGQTGLSPFGYNMIDPLKSWCWGSILFYPFKISRFS